MVPGPITNRDFFSTSAIQLIVTALDMPEKCKYLNLRLRMEQQRLFAWSETSGLLDLGDKGNKTKILESNTFIVNRTIVLDLLVQVQYLFTEFRELQKENRHLEPAGSDPSQYDTVLVDRPEEDARQANVPLAPRRRDFIRRVMRKLRDTTDEAVLRLRWVSFDEREFEKLLERFEALNDNMSDILDAKLQREIHLTVQDTNRGVLQLHRKIDDLGRLVMAFDSKLEALQREEAAAAAAGGRTTGGMVRSLASQSQRAQNADSLKLLSQLARFKAYNESIEVGADPDTGDVPAESTKQPPSDKPEGGRAEAQKPWDEATAMSMRLLRQPGDGRAERGLQIPRGAIRIRGLPSGGSGAQSPGGAADFPHRSEGELMRLGKRERVWIEWKDYDDFPSSSSPSSSTGGPTKADIVHRVRLLVALLSHTPKPTAFRTPQCLGFFDLAEGIPADQVEVRDMRLGLVFARPDASSKQQSLDAHGSGTIDPTAPPVSLRELFDEDRRGGPMSQSPSAEDANAGTKPQRRRLSPPPRYRRVTPSVTQRVALAHAVANCLLHLHAVNWLHKGLRSRNVLFFRGGDSKSPTIDYSRPYLSGFDFSRPARPDEFTLPPPEDDDLEADMYRHPCTQVTGYHHGLSAAPPCIQSSSSSGSGSGGGTDAAPPRPTQGEKAPAAPGMLSPTTAVAGGQQRQRFRRSFDIYALGVLLVEIAHWAPVDEVLGVRAGPGVASRVKDMLLRPYTLNPQAGPVIRSGGKAPPPPNMGGKEGDMDTTVDVLGEVAARMGDVYAAATRVCLEGGAALDLREGDDEEADDAVAARLAMRFYEQVVGRLADIKV